MGKVMAASVDALQHNGFIIYLADCKSVAIRFGGSNPPSSTTVSRLTAGLFLFPQSLASQWMRGIFCARFSTQLGAG